MAQQDYAEAFGALNEAMRNALIMLIATLAFVVLAAYVLTRGLSKPILGLTAVADQISRGKLDMQVVAINRTDEIGALARAIDRLGVSNRLAMERLARSN